MTTVQNLSKWLPARYNELALVVAIVVVVLFTMAADSNHAYFHDPVGCATEIVRNTSLLGIFALGAAVVIVAGGIDLSTGSTIAFSATVCASLMLMGGEWLVQPLEKSVTEISDQQKKGAGLTSDAIEALPEIVSLKSRIASYWLLIVPVAALGAITSGFLVGTLHAWLINCIRLPPFIATLATLVGLRSLARVMIDGVSKCYGISGSQINLSDPFCVYIVEHVWVQVVVFVVLGLVTWFLLSRTLLGRHIYALGGNEQAARLSGIRTQNVKWFAYCFASMTASVAGILLMASLQSAMPTTQAQGYELNAIAAAVVGGCSLQGGIGTVQGTLLGALFIRAVIDSVAKIIKTGADVYEGLIVGSVVAAAVTFSQLRQIWNSGQELFPGLLGIFVIVAISVFTWLFAASHEAVGPGWGALIALCALVLLGVLKVIEVRRHQRS